MPQCEENHWGRPDQEIIGKTDHKGAIGPDMGTLGIQHTHTHNTETDRHTQT